MKILHVYKTFYPDSLGGCEQIIDTLAHQGSRFGQQHHLITTGPENQLRNYSYLTVYCYRYQITVASCPFSIGFFKNFHQQATWADIIHLHFPWPFADLTMWLRRIRKPILVTYHSDIVKQRYLKNLYAPLMHHFLNRANIICPTSVNLIDSSPVLSKYSKRCHSILLGLEELKYKQQDESILYQLPENILGNYMLFIGTFRYYKGLDVLLNAVQETEIPLVIVGDGIARHELIKKCLKRNIKKIYFLGVVNDCQKNALLKNCLAVVLPSTVRSEAFGLSLLEGALSAKPLISTELGTGTSFINQHNQTGFVVPPHDEKELKRAMLNLYNNRVLAETMGQRALQRYRQYFTAEMMSNAYRSVYERLLEDPIEVG